MRTEKTFGIGRSLLLAGAVAAAWAVQGVPANAVVLGLACGFEGRDYELCKDAAEIWAARTGNTVLTYPIPDDLAERLALFSAVLSEDVPKFDVISAEVTSAAALADDLLSLGDYLPYAAYGQSETMIRQLTIGGELKGLPFYQEMGGLYYRTDLLEKYGVEVPESWGELEAAARLIQDGERAEGNDAFWGYLFQGGLGEALAANATEWMVSHSGEPIVGSRGVDLTDPRYIEGLQMAAGWVGTISPPEVLSFDEEAARALFQRGNAAFMRNLPYAFPLLESPISAVSGKVGAAFMPSAHDNPPVSLLEGWSMVVARGSPHPAEAAFLADFLTSVAQQRMRALEADFFPSQVVLFSDTEVSTHFPLVDTYELIEANIRMRPAHLIGKGYAEGSKVFQEAVHAVLRGDGDAATVMAEAQTQIREILVKARQP